MLSNRVAFFVIQQVLRDSAKKDGSAATVFLFEAPPFRVQREKRANPALSAEVIKTLSKAWNRKISGFLHFEVLKVCTISKSVCE